MDDRQRLLTLLRQWRHDGESLEILVRRIRSAGFGDVAAARDAALEEAARVARETILADCYIRQTETHNAVIGAIRALKTKPAEGGDNA